MPETGIRRFWKDAHEKLGRDYVCRICLRGQTFDPTLSNCIYDLHMGIDRIEAAHSIGRAFQDEQRTGPRGAKRLYVNPDSIIPLCTTCHRLYDQRKLSLLGNMTMPEYRNAIRACKKAGLDVRRRLGGGVSASNLKALGTKRLSGGNV